MPLAADAGGLQPRWAERNTKARPARCGWARWGFGWTLVLLAGCGLSPQGPSTQENDSSSRVERGTGASFDERFERDYLKGWQGADAGSPAPGALGRSTAVRAATVRAFLRDYTPLETATVDGLPAMAESGDAFRDAEGAMAELGLDPDDLVDVFAMHHAVHWAVVNRDRVRREHLPAIRAAVASSPRLIALQSADAGSRQVAADRAALLAAIRSREYVALLQAGDSGALQRYADRVAAEFRQQYGIDLRESDAGSLPTDRRGASRSR